MIDQRDVIEATDWWLHQCDGDTFAESMVLGFAADLLGLSVEQVQDELSEAQGSWLS